MIMSVQQLADNKVYLFWLQVDQVEVLRKSGDGPIKICLGLVVIGIVDLCN